ncbi:MAG: hypothetical protein H7A51_15090 [Akkermansiaceae bacterium]|nr:hypothetical protein [Akkermansiaceae bacterium]
MNILHRLFPPLGKRRAMRIAMRHCQPELESFKHCSASIDQLNIYCKPTEPCWLIYAPWLDGRDREVLRSSRIIMVSKSSGEVLYDGSANDEG